MSEENKVLNIYQRMAKITDELGRVAKNLNVGTGNSSYKAVGEADVLEAVKPLETKYGVYSYPYEREVIHQEMLEWEEDYVNRYNKDENGKPTVEKKQKRLYVMRIKTTYRFVNVDKPDEFIDQFTFADGLDSGDKGTGKAMTYADKYALMKAYKITTGDDPDQTHSNTYDKGNVKQNDLPISQTMIDVIQKELKDDVSRIEKILEYYKVKSFSDLSHKQGEQILNKLKKK